MDSLERRGKSGYAVISLGKVLSICRSGSPFLFGSALGQAELRAVSRVGRCTKGHSEVGNVL